MRKPDKPNRLNKLTTASLAFCCGVLSSPQTFADDTEIYVRSANTADMRPNILFIMDTSGSMGSSVSGDPLGRNRLQVMQDSLTKVLDSISNVNVGIMRYSSPGNYDNNGGPVLYPIRFIDDPVGNAVIVSKVTQSTDDAAEEEGTGTVSVTDTHLDVYEKLAGGSGGSGGTDTFQFGNASDYSENGTVGKESGGPNEANIGTEKIGWRFDNIKLDPGVVIDDARLIMQSIKKKNGPGTARIKIEDVGDAATYSSGNTAQNRTYWNSYVEWTVPKSNKKKVRTYTSPDLSTLLQHAVDRSDWSYGNAIGLYFEPHGGNRSLCTPTNKNGCDDPVLEVTWHNPSPPTAGGSNQKVGLRFSDVKVPQGAQVISAHIEFVAKGDRTDPTDLVIYGEDNPTPATFTTTPGDISNRPVTSNSVNWPNVESWYDGNTYNSPELKNIIEEIVADPSWCGGNDMAFVISGTQGTRTFMSYDNGDPTLAPKLVVEFDQSGNGCTTGSAVKTVIDSSDDAEFTGGSANDTTSARLDLDTNAFIGFRFPAMAIPNGATIESANLTMTARDASTASTTVEIYLLSDTNPSYFKSTPTIDSPLTSGKILWTIPPFAANDVLVTPDISPLIEELVARGSWVPNNAIAVVMKVTSANNTGSIKSYDSSPGQAATLKVNYRGQYIPSGMTVRTHLKNTVANFTATGYTPISGTLAEAAKYFRGEDVTFGKVRGNPARSKFVTSHPDSWAGGTLVLPTGCPSWDSTNSNCKNAYISGTPKYISPLNECAPTANHILFLSDGLPNSHGNTTAGIIRNIIANTPGAPASSCGGSDAGKQCAIDLARTMANYDQATTIPNDQRVFTSTISFANNIQVMEDIANAGGGDYYLADDEQTLVDALVKFTQSALASSASFVAAGVSVSQFNRLANDDQLYYALFKPADVPQWPGNVKRYKLDTEHNDILDANDNSALDGNGNFSDSAVSFWKQSKDALGNNIPDGKEVELGGVAASMPATRNVYTYLGSNTNLTNSVNLVSESNSSLTATLLGDSAMSTTKRDLLLKWARGLDVNDIDGDGNTSEVRLQMGDPMHSRPTVVKYDTGSSGPSTDDSAVLFVGTNQGYLHAINADDGDGQHTDDGNELWAFVPKELLPNLLTFYENQPSSSRPYGLDGPISIYHEDSDHDGLIDASETAILYVGMRRGGRNYYALDISNRTAPKFKFMIEGGTNGSLGDYTELGQTWSAPLVRKIRWNGSDVQAIFFGGGYDTNQDAQNTAPVADSMGRTVFVANALTGELLWSARDHAVDESTIDSSWPATSDAKVNLVASIPGNLRVIDFNRNGYADTIYASDQNGQIFRFDINEGNNGATDFAAGGRIAHLNENTVDGNRRFYYEPDTSLVVLNNEKNFVAIAIGSGHRAHPLDTGTKDHIYVLRDYGVLDGRFEWDVALSDLADVSEEVEDTAARVLIKNANNKGWYINLGNPAVGKPGEKVLSATVTFNNTVHITTYVPPDLSSVSSCEASEGSSRLWLVDVIDGTPLERNIVDIENPQLEERHVDLQQPGIGDTVNILDTGGDQVIQAGLDVQDAVPSPPGSPMKVHRRFKDRTPVTFP